MATTATIKVDIALLRRVIHDTLWKHSTLIVKTDQFDEAANLVAWLFERMENETDDEFSARIGKYGFTIVDKKESN